MDWHSLLQCYVFQLYRLETVWERSGGKIKRSNEIFQTCFCNCKVCNCSHAFYCYSITIMWCRAFGLEAYLLSARECYEKWPLMKYDDLEVVIKIHMYTKCKWDITLQGGMWIPSDGTVNPTDLCQSFAKGATQKGNCFTYRAGELAMNDHMTSCTENIV